MKVKLRSKKLDSFIYADIRKGKLAVDKKGFVEVAGHNMHMSTMNINNILGWYVVPEEMQP